MKIRTLIVTGGIFATALVSAPVAHAQVSPPQGPFFPWACQTYYPQDDIMVEPGQALGSGSVVCVANYELAMQSDGNLVEYNYNGKAVWSTGTWGHAGAHVEFQTDGNVVVYGTDHTALWNTGTWWSPDAYFKIQQDGNLVLYKSGTSQAIWASNTQYA
jgi:hypothetical protein